MKLAYREFILEEKSHKNRLLKLKEDGSLSGIELKKVAAKVVAKTTTKAVKKPAKQPAMKKTAARKKSPKTSSVKSGKGGKDEVAGIAA